MKVTKEESLRIVAWIAICLAWILSSVIARAQGIATTTVQGTVYLANGLPGSGTLQVSWPAFTTASNQAVTAGRMNLTIGADGYVSLKLAPNQGATPAGLYYTAVYHLSDGSTSTEYWVVPAAAQASLSQIRAQVMPAAQAVQAVSKTYVDQSIQELTQSLLTASGGSLSGPLFLNGDPAQPTQAANKHYVDTVFSKAVPLSGGKLTGPLTSVQLGAAYQVDQFPGADFGTKLQACLNNLDPTYGGTCDARNFTGTQSIGSNLVIATANATVQLPCATIATPKHIQISGGTRNVTLHGCSLRGASSASGSQGGTVFLYSGSGPMIQIGDSTYATDTQGFHIDNAVMNTTASTDPSAQGMAAYRTQEMDLASLYFLGNSNQTGITLDGTGNYTGGTFQDIQLGGYGTAVNAVGHQVANSATTDWVNASAFLRLHINCPTTGGNAIAGTYGINLQQGDGNTFTGGDVEGCSTALHLGPNAQNNTIVGLRNENSINQVVADAGSSYNNWIAGGTMFTGQLTDNGTRNSFLDTFHRSFNGLNGDWYGSQKDATVTNHYRIGTGAGNERGLLNRYQTDFGYRWTTGLSDAVAGEQFYQILDELNNVYRLSIGQYNNGQSSTNNQTVINSAGAGAIVLNGSSNAGTGGVLFGAGGGNGGTVASINNTGNAQFNGSLTVGGSSTFTGSTTVKNQADAEIDSFLWAGATGNQKESYTYKDYTGASQWYMVKDTNNNWALNSAPGGLDSFKAYQSTNSGDTYVNASNSAGHIRLNYESGSGAETDIYAGSSGSLVAAFLGASAVKFPGLASSSGRNCLQIDNSGYISNTGSGCGGMNGTVNSGTAGQVAFYSGNGTVISGATAVGVTAGGTGATSATQALANLGAQPAIAGVSSDGANGIAVAAAVTAATSAASANKILYVMAPPYNAKCDGVTDDQAAIQAAFNDSYANGQSVQFPAGTCLTGTITYEGQSFFGAGINLTTIKGKPGQDVFQSPDGTTALLQDAQVHDFKLLVDSSVDASATVNGGNNTFPNRIAGTKQGLTNYTVPIAPGPLVFGYGSCGGATASLATPTTVTVNCGITNKLTIINSSRVIGAPIAINGAGPAGGTYTGTITAIGSFVGSTQTLTISPAISTAVTNAKGSMLNAITPPWYIGNAGFALQCSNGNACTGIIQGWHFYNILIQPAGTPAGAVQYNHTAGFFTQVALYRGMFRNINIQSMYGGYIEAPPPAGAVGTADTASYTDFDVSSAVLPFVTMNGSNRTLRGVHLYASGGIQSMCNYFLNSNETANWGATGWQISDLYCEGTNTMSGEIARFMSGPYHVAGADMGAGVSTQAWIQFKGSGSSWFGGEGAPLLVSGNSNKFDHVSGTITDAGQDNVFENQSISGTNNYMGRRYNPSARPFRDAIGKLDGSAIASGSMTAPYLNNSDLFTICDDWAFGVFSGSVSGSCVYDPTGTEISKSYLQSATATNQFDLVGNAQGAAWQNAWNGAPRIIGTHVPLTKATAYVMAQCVGAATCSTIGRVADAQTSSPLGFGTLNFTNAWSVQSFPVDFTSATVGDVINLRLTNWMNTGTNYRVAYFAIQPVNQDEHTWLAANGLPADPANPATLLRPVDKTGAGLTTGPTSSVNLDMAVFDGTTGKIKDGGPAPAAMLSNVPTWLQFLGDGSSGAYNCTSGTCAAVGGEYWYSSFNLSSGTTLPVSNAFAGNDAMIVHSPGTCTIAGMVTASPNTGGGSNNGAGLYGGGSGGGGGGTGAGAAGNPALAGATGAGAAGAAGGGPGGNGSSTGAYIQKILLASGLASSGTSTGLAAFGGAAGGAGGSGGGAGGKGGGLVIFDCQTINFTGTIDVSGQNGTTASGNNTGGGGGGAGGVVILRSPNMTNSGTFNVTGGSGGGCAAFTGCGAGGSGATGWSKVYAQ